MNNASFSKTIALSVGVLAMAFLIGIIFFVGTVLAQSLWDWSYCSPAQKCKVGQGDCDSDADCETGYCAKNVGAKYGKSQWLDVCEIKITKIGVEKLAQEAISQYYTLAAPSITPKEIFYFNPQKNSGWFYIAQTVPENGIAFWVAAIRSISTNPTDTSAQLLYGITNINTGSHYPGFLDGGSFFEDSGKVNLFYEKGGKKILEFRQTKTDLSEFELKVKLPWGWVNYETTKTLTLSRPILYESGDGIIPMAPGVDSLYASIVTDQGFWIDFQKFNIDSLSQLLSIKYKANHRWGSIILNKSVGAIPAGTVGVAWEILDENNQRRPGGYTNVDLLAPGFPQFTAKEAQFDMGEIEEIEYWNSGHKTYLKKWKMSYPGGIELLFETLIPNQENEVMGDYFYEGMIKVINPKTGEQVGSGMLEQTHDEASDRILWSWDYCSPTWKCKAGEGDCDSDADCQTGYCAKNVGAKYGKSQWLDVCETK